MHFALNDYTYSANGDIVCLFQTTKAFLPAMLKRDHGHIVSIASGAGLGGTCGLCDYCASKFGAVGFQESLHMELKAMKKEIHTTVVCPYYINTGMFDGAQTRCVISMSIILFILILI